MNFRRSSAGLSREICRRQARRPGRGALLADCGAGRVDSPGACLPTRVLTSTPSLSTMPRAAPWLADWLPSSLVAKIANWQPRITWPEGRASGRVSPRKSRHGLESGGMTDETEFDFEPDELRAAEALKGTLNKVAEWPPDSPLSFVLSLASRTRGKLGEMLLAQIAEVAGIETGKASQSRTTLESAKPGARSSSPPRIRLGFSRYETRARLLATGTTIWWVSLEGRTGLSTG